MFFKLLPVNLKSFSKTWVVSDSSSGLIFFLMFWFWVVIGMG